MIGSLAMSLAMARCLKPHIEHENKFAGIQTPKSKLSIQFLRKRNGVEGDYYVLHDYDSLTPQGGDYVINKTDNFLVESKNTGGFHTFKVRAVANSFCASVPEARIVWERGSFISIDDIPPADPADVDQFFAEAEQGADLDAVELADSEFVNLLETLTHKKLSDTHKNILLKILNKDI